MNICGVLVHAIPAETDAVAAGLGALGGVEVHQREPDGRIVVTVEDTATAPAIDTISAIQRFKGVVAASLVYHHFDADAEAAASNRPGEPQ